MNTSQIKNVLLRGEISKARAMILAQLDKDRFLEPMKTRQILQTLMPSDASQLFDPDDGQTAFAKDQNWTSQYWTEVCVELSNNFSKEKLNHAIAVMKDLREKQNSRFLPTHKKETVGSSHKDSGPRRESVVVGRKPGFLDKLFSNR